MGKKARVSENSILILEMARQSATMGDNCSLSEEVKAEAKGYMNSLVIGRIDRVLRYLRGEITDTELKANISYSCLMSIPKEKRRVL